MDQHDLRAELLPFDGTAPLSTGVPAGRAPRGARILYVVPPSPSFAGVERVIHDVANAISARPDNPFAVSVLYFSEYAALGQERIRYEPIIKKAGRLRQTTAVLRKLLRERRFDLVIVPQVEASTFAAAALPPRGTRMVVYLHGNPWVERTRSLQSRSLFLLFRLLAVRRYHGAFAVTPTLAREFQQAHPSLREACWVPNPVRRFRERRDDGPRGRGSVTFLNVGRLSFQKGQDILLQAFAEVHVRRPRTRLVIVGHGAMQEELDARIAELGLQRAVEIRSMPTNPGPAFAEADVFVSSSRWEGWSLVIVEALSFGLPVVATDCDFGPRDILTDPRLGCLVSNGDVAALADAMVARCDGAVEEAMEDAAFREEHAAGFRIENVVTAHMDAIRAMVA